MLCIDHQTKSYPCYSHGWPWLEHNVQPARTDVRSKAQQHCQQAKCYEGADPVLHHRLHYSLLDVSGKLSY